MINEKSLQNLRPFKKGQVTNPNGRPKGSKNITTQVIRILKKVAPDMVIDTDVVRAYCGDLKRITNADAAAAALVAKASAGDIAAIKEINDRCEGKARQAIDLAGEAGRPVEILYRVVYEPDDGYPDQS